MTEVLSLSTSPRMVGLRLETFPPEKRSSHRARLRGEAQCPLQGIPLSATLSCSRWETDLVALQSHRCTSK